MVHFRPGSQVWQIITLLSFVGEFPFKSLSLLGSERVYKALIDVYKRQPRGDYQVFEDARGGQWYAIRGEAAVERKPVYQDGKPVYDGDNVRTVSVETVRYKNTPSRLSLIHI